MAETTGQERTESATPRRRQKARSEGQVPRSMEVNSIVVLATSLTALAFLGPSMVEKAAAVLRFNFGSLTTLVIHADTVPVYAAEVAAAMAAIVLPFAALIATAGVAANVGQNGFLLTAKTLQPKFSRIDPRTGLKRIFSKRGAVELAKSLLKIAVVGAVVGWALMNTVESFVPLMNVQVFAAYGTVIDAMLKMAAAAAAALTLVAILDFFFQRFDHEQQLKMTRQEVKDEHKQNEGDPQLKGKIRARQQEISRRRMMQDVETADVVVTNPIRFAVALKYDAEKGGAPRVVAKGARLIARRIREIAREAGVPIVENPPLARSLFKACRVGAEVPLSLYGAVAELLAFVYRQRDRAAGGVR